MNNLAEIVKQSATTQEDIASVLNELVLFLKRPNIAADDELWTCEDIAAYLKLSTATVERRVVVRPEFPEAIQPCATGKHAVRRWFAGDVIRWAKQNKGKLPKSKARGRQPSRPAISEAVAL
ncbi:hypothetical protein [Ventosimonas gracilis]|uniref:hypothetical protein n=1 Tax=Ventosimonas gracilis TaxID=1680762 RepID=UPI000837EDC9|nr:hypothetical protein [Ventosimonas gracilis]